MARIIEYDERDYGESRGFGGGGLAFIVILVLVVLYFSGYMPWFSSVPSSIRPGEIVAPIGAARPGGTIAYVTADNLNMRVAPGNYSQVTYILPQGTRVTLLGETYRELDGDMWVQVRIQTNEGLQVGWVNRRYIS